jgi:hypothetical protein
MTWRQRVQQVTSHRSFPKACDIAMGLLWLLLGWVMFIGRYQGQFPFMDLDSDASQIASFAAAQGNPDAFVGDFLLNDPRNYNFYFTLQIPLARLMASVVGDIGLALIMPLPLLYALQGFGFYLWGRTLFGHRFFGLLFSVAVLPVIRIVETADYWGARGFTTPRDWFQAILPYILVLALTKAGTRRGRFLVMGLTGLLIYVHPVSTPPWACAIWLGLWWGLPNSMSLRQKAVEMASLAGVFLVLSAPFFSRFLWGGKQDPVPVEDVLLVLKYRYQAGYWDLSLVLKEVIRIAHTSGTLYFSTLGAYLLWRRRSSLRPRLLVVASWFAGLVLLGIIAVWVDHTLAELAGRVPVQLDLVRAVRYLFPLGWMLGFWGFAQLVLNVGNVAVKSISFATSMAFVISLFVRYPMPDFLSPGWALIRSGTLFPAAAAPTPLQGAIDAVKRVTPVGSRFFATNMQDAAVLRYQGLRPVVFSYKDGGTLGYSNHRALLLWFGRDKVFTGLFGRSDRWREIPLTFELASRMVDVARAWNADYILYPGAMFPLVGTEIAYQNEIYTLMKLN